MSDPIEETIRETARILGFEVSPRMPYITPSEGWLMMAQVMRELAERVVELEKEKTNAEK